MSDIPTLRRILHETKRIAVVGLTVGISAVVFGLAGICASKIQRWPCTCVIGLLALLLTAVYGLAAFVLMSMYYVSDQQVKDFCNDNLNL